MNEEDYDCPEDHTYFEADECTCEHDADEHGLFSGCSIEGCDCEASWVY